VGSRIMTSIIDVSNCVQLSGRAYNVEVRFKVLFNS
jgi:hypothetical protein